MERPRVLLGATAEAWALIVAMPLAQVANVALTVVVARLREDLVLTYSELGLVLAGFGLARLVMDLPAGAVVQRFNPRRVALVALALTLLSAGIGWGASAAWQVGLARIIHGAASAVVQTAILAWLVGRASAAGRGRVMALSEACFSVVSLTTPTLVGLLAGPLGWRAAFATGLVGALTGAGVVLAWTRADSAARAIGKAGDASAEDARGAGWGGLRAGGSLLVLAGLVTFLVFFSRQALSYTLLPLVGVEQVGLSSFEVGLAVSLLSGVSIVAILAGGWLGDRLGRRRLVVPGMLVMLVGQLGLFLIADRVSFFAVAAVLGVGYLLSFLPVSLVGDALPAAARARGIAVYRLVADAAVLLAPLAVGVATDLGGYDAAKLGIVLSTGGIVLVAGWLQVWGRAASGKVRRRLPSGQPARQHW